MVVIVLNISKLISPSILNTFILIAIGAIIYFVILLILKDKFLNDIINQVVVTVKNKLGKGTVNE